MIKKLLFIAVLFTSYSLANAQRSIGAIQCFFSDTTALKNHDPGLWECATAKVGADSTLWAWDHDDSTWYKLQRDVITSLFVYPDTVLAIATNGGDTSLVDLKPFLGGGGVDLEVIPSSPPTGIDSISIVGSSIAFPFVQIFPNLILGGHPSIVGAYFIEWFAGTTAGALIIDYDLEISGDSLRLIGEDGDGAGAVALDDLLEGMTLIPDRVVYSNALGEPTTEGDFLYDETTNSLKIGSSAAGGAGNLYIDNGVVSVATVESSAQSIITTRLNNLLDNASIGATGAGGYLALTEDNGSGTSFIGKRIDTISIGASSANLDDPIMTINAADAPVRAFNIKDAVNESTQDFRISTAADPGLILNEGNSTTDSATIVKTSATQLQIQNRNEFSSSTIRLDPLSSSGAQSQVTLFRLTNSAEPLFTIFTGNGTSTASFVFNAQTDRARFNSYPGFNDGEATTNIAGFAGSGDVQRFTSLDYSLIDTTGSGWNLSGGGGSDADWTIGSGVVYNTTDDIGIGTSTPGFDLHIMDSSASADLAIETTQDQAASFRLKNSTNEWNFEGRNSAGGGTVRIRDVTNGYDAMQIYPDSGKFEIGANQIDMVSNKSGVNAVFFDAVNADTIGMRTMGDMEFLIRQSNTVEFTGAGAIDLVQFLGNIPVSGEQGVFRFEGRDVFINKSGADLAWSFGKSPTSTDTYFEITDTGLWAADYGTSSFEDFASINLLAANANDDITTVPLSDTSFVIADTLYSVELDGDTTKHPLDQVKVLTADADRTTTTYSAVSDLTFNVVAGESYIITYFLPITASAGGIKYKHDGSCTLSYYIAGDGSAPQTTFTGDVINISTAGGSSNTCQAMITVSGSGTFELHLSQVDGDGGTTTLHQGAWAKIKKL